MITDNSTGGDGDGLFLDFNPGFSNLSLHSIIAGNRAGQFGGGDFAALNLLNSGPESCG